MESQAVFGNEHGFEASLTGSSCGSKGTRGLAKMEAIRGVSLLSVATATVVSAWELSRTTVRVSQMAGSLARGSDRWVAWYALAAAAAAPITVARFSHANQSQVSASKSANAISVGFNSVVLLPPNSTLPMRARAYGPCESSGPTSMELSAQKIALPFPCRPCPLLVGPS